MSDDDYRFEVPVMTKRKRYPFWNPASGFVGGLITALVAGILIMIFLLLVSCSSVTPFVEGGAGYSDETGDYGDIGGGQLIDESGFAGTLAIGIEFSDERWYMPSECGFYHRSMVHKRPEIVTNDVACKKRVRFAH